MSALYNNAVKQSNILKKHLAELRAAPEDAPSRVVGQVSSSITAFQRAIDSYSSAADNEIVADKKQLAQERVAKFREELVKSRDELRALKTQREDSINAQSRNELFRRNIDSSPGISENPFANGGTAQDGGMVRASGMVREGDVLAKATQSIDEFIEMGRHALSDMGEQNEMLRKTGKSLKKVANTLGISNETIRKVQKRAKEDKLIFYGGACLMLVCFYFIIRWLR